MVNDTTTLNGSLMELGELMAENLTTQGLIGVSASDGLTTLANAILDIQGGSGGSTTIYEDDCSIDNTSDYGSSIALRNSGTSTLAYDSNGYYTITNTKSQAESFIPITDLTGVTDDFILEYDSYVQGSNGSSGLVIYNSSTAWEKLTDDADSSKKLWYGYNNGTFHETAFYGNTVTNQKWVHYKYTVQGTTFSMEVTYNNSTVVTHSETMHLTRDSSTKYGLDSEWQSNTVTRYKNITVEKINNNDCSQYQTQIENAINYINGVSTYALSFSQSTYTYLLGDSITVSATLTINGSPLANETLTFTHEENDLLYGTTTTVTNTATTNSNGVATMTIADTFSIDNPCTVTVTAKGETATCTLHSVI